MGRCDLESRHRLHSGESRLRELLHRLGTAVSDRGPRHFVDRDGNRSHAIGSTTGVRLHPERLDQPLRWRKPRRVFVNSLSDLFHGDVPDDYIARVFAVMALAPQHTFQVLTKRHGRMRSLLSSGDFADLLGECIAEVAEGDYAVTYPLPNVWLGVTVEDQKRADLRIPALLDTPAAVRFLSCEPLLGPVDLRLGEHVGEDCQGCSGLLSPAHEPGNHWYPGEWSDIDWVICGGESGPDARHHRTGMATLAARLGSSTSHERTTNAQAARLHQL